MTWPPDGIADRDRPAQPGRISYVLAWLRWCLEAPTGRERRARAEQAPEWLRPSLGYHLEDYLRKLASAYRTCLEAPDPVRAADGFPAPMRRDLRRALRRMER